MISLWHHFYRNTFQPLHQKVLKTPTVTQPLFRPDQTGCDMVNMNSPDGYWIFKDEEWTWAVAGCLFIQKSSEEAAKCVETRFVK